MPSEKRSADELRLALAEQYFVAAHLLAEAGRHYKQATVAELAAESLPVRYRHASTRDLEDALDEALTAL